MNRRDFLKTTSFAALTAGIPRGAAAFPADGSRPPATQESGVDSSTKADYSLHIANGVLELSPKRFVSTTLYNGDFPGPLLRFKQDQPVIVDIFNNTDTPEQVH